MVKVSTDAKGVVLSGAQKIRGQNDAFHVFNMQ